MKLKVILAAALAVAMIGTISVTAIAASDTGATTDRTARAAWGRKQADPFAKLLEDGVVTQSTYDKMKAYIEENSPQKPEQRSEQKFERTDMLDTLLNAGVITQKDYDALKAAMEAKMTEMKANMESRMSGIKEKLASGEKPERPDIGDKTQRPDPYAQFVTDGVITQETANAIKAYFEANRPAANGNAQKLERTDMFQKMLDAGVITQQEYDAIKAAMPA